MNIAGLKEHIHYNFPNLMFVEKPSVDELIIKKMNVNKLFSIKSNVIKNEFTVQFPNGKYIINNLSALFTLLEYIN